ncbi:MAG: response regulator transcription factor [Anaerolineales bacterium]|nr:response regulator transcription factor [Anaerolineales bacterium]
MQDTENSRQSILVIDDDETGTSALCSFLKRCGFTTFSASNGREGLQSVQFSAPDLIVCDVLMPEMDGREFLRCLRAEKYRIPVIMLSRVGETHEKVLSLEEGADDYINKPYDPLELVARIRSVLRRSQMYQPSLSYAWMLTAGDLLMNRQRREVYLQGELLQLTRRAFLLLEYMLTHPDEILSRERLLEIVWGWENLVDTRTVDTRIGELRKALHDQAEQPRYIETVPQEGYRFIHPVKASA